MIQPTTLIYSSHNRCDYLHRHFIVERALQSPDNKTILFLPMSMGELDQQEYSYGTFSWYFKQFEQYGLKHWPFYWREHLAEDDVQRLFHDLFHAEVVILGGGNSDLGKYRYRHLGADYFGDADLFARILHERQDRGKLTVGFSAGADQLAHQLASAIEGDVHDPSAFGLARRIMVTLHHEHGREGELAYGARRFPDCLVFGLPNDSGLAVSQGRLLSGNYWQHIEFIIDQSWDLPQDSWHIKTRMGMGIDHFYPDGRAWTFRGGERMLRIFSPDGQWQEAWMATHNRPLLHYWSQQPTFHQSFEEILGKY